MRKPKNIKGQTPIIKIPDSLRETDNQVLQLIIANSQNIIQIHEKMQVSSELIMVNKELAIQNDKKEKRAAELIIANIELAFQNKEKEKRAAELIIANSELAFQNEEKEKRAAELIIAVTELAFQNEEKEKRAAELIIANTELAFQNNEKEKRAKELIRAIDDLKISGEQITEMNKELESFSYSVSHDLRAPLRAITGYVTKLKRGFETQLDQEANRLMNNIVLNTHKMSQLIDDLLAFSRIGRRELVKTNIPVNEIVAEIYNEIKNELPDRSIEVRIKELLPAQADNMAIRQVWLNLISNAVKYTRLKTPAVIDIGSEVQNGEVVYFIKDNGVGFDMRYADNLFGVFQRLHTDEEFEGTGVGLALVQRLISKHGGRIWADARVDEGAQFYFTLQPKIV